MGGYSEEAGEGGEGRVGRRAARGAAQGSEGAEGRPPLQLFRQPAIPPVAGREVEERVWKRISGEAARLGEGDREVAERERRVREEEAALARGGTGPSQTRRGTLSPWR